MKILLVTPFLPYPAAGHAASKYCYYLLRTLAYRNEVHLVARTFPGEETHIPHLRRLAARVEVVEGPGAYSTPSPTMLARVVGSYRCLGMLAKTVLEKERFDLCQVECTESGVFWTAPRGIPAVMTLHDVQTKPAKRRYLAAGGLRRAEAWAKWRVTRAVETFAASKFQHLFVLSDEDRRWASELWPKTKVRILRYPAGIEFVGLVRREAPGRVLFVGALNRPANVEAIEWFVDRCWPGIRGEIPDAEFHIVGHGLSETHRIRWSADSGIKVIGPVESVEQHYKEAAVFVAPILTGGGIIVKILDGLAAGVPVVTTTRGNEGIGADGEAILIADSPDIFALSVIRLLKNRELRAAMGECGRQYVRHTFSPAVFASTLDETYAELTQGRRPPSVLPL